MSLRLWTWLWCDLHRSVNTRRPRPSWVCGDVMHGHARRRLTQAAAARIDGLESIDSGRQHVHVNAVDRCGGLMHGPGHKYLRECCCCCVVVGPAAGGVRGRVRSSHSKGGRAREKTDMHAEADGRDRGLTQSNPIWPWRRCRTVWLSTRLALDQHTHAAAQHTRRRRGRGPRARRLFSSEGNQVGAASRRGAGRRQTQSSRRKGPCVCLVRPPPWPARPPGQHVPD